MTALEQFKKQKYLNLEPSRRNGKSMDTPLWFVQDDEIIYVQTMANSGKHKRIRNNGNVNITPCKLDGAPNCSWVPASAREVTGVEIAKKVNCLLKKEIWPDEKSSPCRPL